ncbi:ABC transporter permease [candidate division KSB1 bacterium]|nr:ABC transporter permease [candidate division KSB1 bacterium]
MSTLSLTINYTTTFRDNWQLQTGVIILFVLIVLTIGANIFATYDPDAQGDLLQDRYLSPSTSHIFGTDKFGRDVFSRVLYGGRLSLMLAISVVVLSLIFGLLYGGVAAYAGGWIDTAMMRLLDFWLAFPAIFLIMTVVALFRPSPASLVIILSAIGWMETARFVRADVLTLKNQEFIIAAQCLGYHPLRILLHHLLPNCWAPVLATAPLKVAEMILLESSLSFLGIGIQPPLASWGTIINDGRVALFDAWWISLFPGVFIMLTVIGFNFLGEGLRRKSKLNSR